MLFSISAAILCLWLLVSLTPKVDCKLFSTFLIVKFLWQTHCPADRYHQAGVVLLRLSSSDASKQSSMPSSTKADGMRRPSLAHANMAP